MRHQIFMEWKLQIWNWKLHIWRIATFRSGGRRGGSRIWPIPRSELPFSLGTVSCAVDRQQSAVEPGVFGVTFVKRKLRR